MSSSASQVEVLRQYLVAHAPFVGARGRASSGHEPLDRLLDGGFPQGGLTVLTGPSGSGQLTVATMLLAEETRAGRPVAWVDVRGSVYPPALASRGVELSRMLMVRGAPDRALYAAEQLIASGLFGAVVASGLERQLGPAALRRLQTSTEGSRTATVLVLEPAAAAQVTHAALRLQLVRRAGGLSVEVEKDRSGRAVGRRGVVVLAAEPSSELTPTALAH
jgi:hypothetical protein